jgi:hypothetical protein
MANQVKGNYHQTIIYTFIIFTSWGKECKYKVNRIELARSPSMINSFLQTNALPNLSIDHTTDYYKYFNDTSRRLHIKLLGESASSE